MSIHRRIFVNVVVELMALKRAFVCGTACVCVDNHPLIYVDSERAVMLRYNAKNLTTKIHLYVIKT